MSLAPLVCLYTVEPPASYQSPPARLWPQSPPLAPVAHPSASSSPHCTQLCLQVSWQHLPISGVSTEAPPQRGPPWSPVSCLPSLSHCPPYSPLDKTLITSKVILHICLSTCLLCIFPHLECPLWGQGPSPSCPALCPLHLVHWAPRSSVWRDKWWSTLVHKADGPLRLCSEVKFLGHGTHIALRLLIGSTKLMEFNAHFRSNWCVHVPLIRIVSCAF